MSAKKTDAYVAVSQHHLPLLNAASAGDRVRSKLKRDGMDSFAQQFQKED